MLDSEITNLPSDEAQLKTQRLFEKIRNFRKRDDCADLEQIRAGFSGFARVSTGLEGLILL